jgi:hypothetical protein
VKSAGRRAKFLFYSYNVMETQKHCYLYLCECYVMLYYREPGIFYKTYEIYFSHPMSFLGRPNFFQNYSRCIPDYIIRTRPEYIIRTAPVHGTETDLHVVFTIVFQSLYMYV